MKRLASLALAALLAAMAISPSIALAQPGPPGYAPPGYRPGPPPGYRPGPGGPGGPGWHRWHRGDRYYGNRYVVRNWQRYQLQPPPPGYQWVQSGNQFVLVAIASGLIASIILNSQYH